MKRKIFIFSALLAGIAVLVTSVLTTVTAYDNFFTGIKREVVAEASYILNGYELSGINYLHTLKFQPGHRLTLISAGGAVIYDSAGSSDNMDNHMDRPEVQAALSIGTGESTRFSDTVKEQTYYFAVLAEDGNVLRMASTTVSVLTAYDRLFAWVALIAFLVILVSSLIATFVTRRIVRPINAIDLEHPENNAVYDEIHPLLKRLKEQRDQIDEQLRALDRGRREFSAITENMSEGFLVLDGGGRILSHNKSAARLFGTRTADVSGSNIMTVNRCEEFRDILRRAMDGETREQVVELCGRQCQIFANPVMEGGSQRGIILLVMDVTEKLERELLRQEFTANVSHELKTPLTAISGYAELMANGMVKAKDIRSFAQNLYREAQYLIALVNDLMFLSGLDENSVLTKSPADLLAIAGESAQRLMSKASEHGVTLSVSGESAIVQGIPSVLDEIVRNLIDNAIKYNRSGGSVSVTVTREGDTAVLCVADTGVGIPPSERDRIFERFYRVDKSHNKSIPGTGLGLSIVKHGVILHGAKIELESSDSGSRFKLVFTD